MRFSNENGEIHIRERASGKFLRLFFKKPLKNKGKQRNCDIFIEKTRSLSKSERAANFWHVFLLIKAITKWLNLEVAPEFIKSLSMNDTNNSKAL